jgi:hypothetical protein
MSALSMDQGLRNTESGIAITNMKLQYQKKYDIAIK